MIDWESLVRRDETAPEPAAITLRQLYDYAHDPAVDSDGEVHDALTRDSRLAADFRRILERSETTWLPQLAAAAGHGEITSRDGEGCRVRFARSEAEPSQTYVMIELADKDAKPTTLFVVSTGPRIHSWPLPPPHRGVIQLLEEEDSELLGHLRDPDTEVFLR